MDATTVGVDDGVGLADKMGVSMGAGVCVFNGEQAETHVRITVTHKKIMCA